MEEVCELENSKRYWERIDRKSCRVRSDLLHNAAHAAQVAKDFNPLNQRQHIAAVAQRFTE